MLLSLNVDDALRVIIILVRTFKVTHECPMAARVPGAKRPEAEMTAGSR